MRVITGSARGLKLLAPDGLDTRPTTDRVKESIFNIIAPYLPAKNVLDLFAGSGALGIEALSRHSEYATFLEKDKKALDIIKKNVSSARLTEKATILGLDAFNFLNTTKERFDLIFLDPPYSKGLLTKAIELIYKNNLLTVGGIIVAESELGGEGLPEGFFQQIKYAKYGKTVIYILKN